MVTNPKAKTILCFGDSNTWGQKPDKSSRYKTDERWPGLLQGTLGDDFYVIEEGLGGRTTDLEYAKKPGRNGKTYLGPCLESHEPIDTIVLMLGTNDLKTEFDRSVDEIGEALKGLVVVIQEKTSKTTGTAARIILVSPAVIDNTAPHFTELYTGYYDHESASKSQKICETVRLVAHETGCVFVNAAEVAQPGADGIHFSLEAHKNLAKKLLSVL
jgi:lysophospholipase L1-like esterase